MCCLFGIIDCNNTLSAKQKSRMISILATECEERGTDATGISYNSRGRLHIYKRPCAAHLIRFRVPDDATCIMGHTRMATQGSEKLNHNNHPFISKVKGREFALAHNGVLYNDVELRITEGLPDTFIETDSYVAVQLIEKKPSTLTALNTWRKKLRVLLRLRLWMTETISTSSKAKTPCVYITIRSSVYTSMHRQKRYLKKH